MRELPLPAPKQGAAGFLLNLNPNNLDLHPIEGKGAQLDSYSGWVYACVQKIAQDQRTNPRNIWVKKGKTRKEWEVLDPKKVSPIFLKPNLTQTWGQLVEQRNMHKDLTGEAYWHILCTSPGGKPIGVEMIQPDWVDEPVFDPAGTMITGWKVTVPGRGASRTLSALDVIPDFYLNPRDPSRGASPIEAFALAHHLDLYLRAYGLKMIRDGAVIGQYISSEGITDEAGADAAEARVMKRYRTPGRIAVLGKGSKVEFPGLPLRDLDMLRILNPSRDQILAIYGVPASKFGLTMGAGDTNQKVADKAYQENCLLPRLLTFDEIVNSILMPRIYGNQAEQLFYESESPVEADREFELKQADTQFQRGAITKNEFLIATGGESIGPEGDVYFIPNTVRVFRTLSDAVAAGEAQDVQPDPNADPANPGAGGGGSETIDDQPDDEPARMFRLTSLADRIGEKIANVAALGEAAAKQRALEEALRKARKDNAVLRAAGTLDKLEARFKKDIRALFDRERKQVVKGLEENFDSLRDIRQTSLFNDRGEIDGAVTRDWLDRILDRLSRDWQELVRTIISESARAGWKLTEEEVAGTLQWSVFQQKAAEYAQRHAAAQVSLINATTEAELRRVIRNGIESGDGIAELTRKVADTYDGWKSARAENIARTETGSAMGYGRLNAARETANRLGMNIVRSWISVHDDRTRPDHVDADADVNERNRDIGLNDFYIVGGIEMSHPGDPGAPAEQICNCRCTETYRDADS